MRPNLDDPRIDDRYDQAKIEHLKSLERFKVNVRMAYRSGAPTFSGWMPNMGGDDNWVTLDQAEMERLMMRWDGE